MLVSGKSLKKGLCFSIVTVKSGLGIDFGDLFGNDKG